MSSYLDEEEELAPLDETPEERAKRLGVVPPSLPAFTPGDGPSTSGPNVPAPDGADFLSDTPSRPPGKIPVVENAEAKRNAVTAAVASKEKDANPKWWQRALAGAVGFGTGYSNAEGKANHIDAAPAVDAIMGGPQNRKRLADWNQRVAVAQADSDAANKTESDWWKNRAATADEQRKLAQDQRDKAAADYQIKRIPEQDKLDAAKRSQAQDKDLLSTPDSDIIPESDKGNVPAGWIVTPSSAQPGMVIVRPPKFAKLPAELAPYAVGAKPGDVVPYSAIQAAQATASKDTLAQNKPVKPPADNVDRILLDPGSYTQDQVKKAQEMFDKMHRPPAAAAVAPGASADDPKIIAQGIMNGHQPPDTKGLYRNGSSVRAELERNGYDLVTAQRDWQAVQKHLSTLNGQQQERLRQAVSFTYDSLDQIEQLYDEWKKEAGVSGVKVFNRAALAASKHLPGKAGEAATLLESQINDLTSELGTVYKGGNGSTDESLRLAGENLKAEWNEGTFKRGVQQIRKNLQIRRNSINNSQAAGVSADSPYLPQQQPGSGDGRGGGPPQGTVHFVDAGVSYDIPVDKAQAFVASHPKAKKGA